jgi:gliding motility-associated-like protein
MKKLVLLILLFFAFNISAQKEANIWYFGENAGLDFSTNPPTALTVGELDTSEGCSSFSNADGNLLFYSDGTEVFNKNHNLMTYSDGNPANNLKGNPSSTQSGMIIPKPGSTSIYYLFTVGTDFVSPGGIQNPGFNYYTIDMTKNSGLGEITDGPINLAKDPNTNLDKSDDWSEKVAAVKGFDCNVFWVLSFVKDTFYSYKVTDTGIDINDVVISKVNFSASDKRGYLQVSPNGEKIAFADYEAYTDRSGNLIVNGSLVLFDFDITSGKVNLNPKTLISRFSGESPYGVAFSQQSTKLYTSSYDGNFKVFQFDLENPDIPSSKKEIVNKNGFRGALQLGPDGKIYASIPNSGFLDVIENPSANAADVIYTQNGIDLQGKFTKQGLPPFISSLLLPIEIVDADDNSVINNQDLEFCAGQNKIIESEPVAGTDATYEWTFDDGTTTSVVERNKDLALDNMIASNSGKYTLLVQLTDICTNVVTFEATFNLKVNPLPTLNTTIPVYEQCDFDTNPNDFIANFNLTTQESKIYSGSDPVTIDFFETADTSFSSPLPKNDYRNSTATNAINGNHKLIVRVTNVATNCAETREIELKVNPSGIDSYPDIYTCELDLNEKIPNSRNSIGSANSFYNFDDKTTDIIVNSSGALDEDTHDFSYFRTREDATLQRNEIVAPYEDDLFNSEAVLFVRISLKNSNACESVGEFSIIIQERPMPQGSADAYLLCLNNPINFPQLITIDLDANTGVSSDTYTWYLNDDLLSNETNAILKANKKGEYRVVTSRLYTNNISNSADDISCTGYNTFTVLESNAARIETFSFVEDENNSENNTFMVMAIGEGDYEFALRNDDKNTTTLFQDEPVFKNIEGGIYTIIIRDKNGCIPNTTLQVSALQFPRFFTPNGDGRNDTWAIKGANNTFYSKSSIRVFNRYGKLVAEPTLDGTGWDGTNNGRILPSDDYWYNIILTPADPSKPTINKIGNFSLLRR